MWSRVDGLVKGMIVETATVSLAEADRSLMVKGHSQSREQTKMVKLCLLYLQERRTFEA